MKKFFDFSIDFLTLHLNKQDLMGIEIFAIDGFSTRSSFFGLCYDKFYNRLFIDILWVTIRIE